MKTRKYLLFLLVFLPVLGIIGCSTNGVDATAPTVTSIAPEDLATDVAINSNVTATFSEAMDPATLTATSVTLKQGATAVAGSISYSGNAVTFNPSANLAYDTEYTATITDAVADEAGNALEANKVWSFTTGQTLDSTAPTVSSTVPLNAATDIAINSNISATFSETMDPATLTATSVTLNQGATAVAGSISYSGNTVTFNPTSDLTNDTEYTATITDAATDVAGNALEANKVWSFTTGQTLDSTAPTVSSTIPVHAATGVAINSNISATFSEAMDHTTITAASVTLKQGSTAVEGTVTYDIPNHAAVFAPADNLIAGTEYTATITTSVSDIAGNTLAENKVWSFTTAQSGSGPAPVSLGTAGNFAVLAKTEISTVPNSAITGDIGISPAAETYITGFSLTDATGYATSTQVTGYVYASDMTPPTPTVMTTAIADMETAYTDAAGRTTPDYTDLGAGDIGGLTLAPGLYKWGSSVTVASDITINGAANDVWIFQISGDLNLSSAVNVTLSGGAQAKNIFWQVAGPVTLGTTSHGEGIVLSQTSIILNTGATINGRLLAQSAVALDQNTVTEPTP